MLVTITTPAETDHGFAVFHGQETARFTIDGSDDLEIHLARVCDQVLAGVQVIVPQRKLEALLLGGGYGRGEGGVLRTEAGDRPYNDLEFYVFVRGDDWLNTRRFGDALTQLAHELSPLAGVEVEFKIISRAKLRRSPVSMFYYDLITGHRRLLGSDKSLSGCGHHKNAQNLSLSEATRLMMNRCTGLLLARQKLEHVPFTTGDADFVQRNLAKAQLALGDAVLTTMGQYHWSCLERNERLRRLPRTDIPWLDELRSHHTEGVKFKLHPYISSLTRSELESRHEAVTAFAFEVWLWLERERLDADFATAADYALSTQNKCPGTNPWRNCLLNLKIFGPKAVFSNRRGRHPREEVLNKMTLLLWCDSVHTPSLPRILNGKLSPAINVKMSLPDYQNAWRQVS